MEPRWAPAVLFSIPASRADIRVSDMLFYQVQTSFNSLEPDGLCFQLGFESALVNRLAVRAVLTRREFVGGEFHLSMAAYDIPTAEDFRAYRYVPLRYYDVCEATFPADNLQAQSFQYFPKGVAAISAWSRLPFKVSVAGLPLAVNYPCREEAQRLAYWFDRPQLAGRDPGAEERVRRFMVASQTSSGQACLAHALPALSAVHTNWREGNLPPAGASCEHDLASVAPCSRVAWTPPSTMQGNRRTRRGGQCPRRRWDMPSANGCGPASVLRKSRITSGERGRRVTVTRPTPRRHWFYPRSSVNSTHRWRRSMRADLPYGLSALVDPSLRLRDARRLQRRDGLLPENLIEHLGDIHPCDRQFGLAGRGRWKICAALLRCTQSLRQAFVGRQTGNRALLCPAKQVLECLAVCARRVLTAVPPAPRCRNFQAAGKAAR